MKLSIFAYHVYCISIAKAPAEFVLHPCDGVETKVAILPTYNNVDEVLINGRYVGNRYGGITEFVKMVCEARPEIQYD